MRAIVFSGGALFGAYHVGAWKVLSKHFQPDLVVGASIGSLFGYLVASGYPIEEIEQEWLTGARYRTPRWRMPRSPLSGFLDPESVYDIMREMTERLTPRIRFAVVARRLPLLQPVIYEWPEITWRHLAASCAVPMIYPAQHIDGCILVDGGIYIPCPTFAAERLGATEVIGLNCMRGGTRQVSAKSYVIGAKGLLGSPREAFVYDRSNIERWIEMGERDVTEALAAGAIRRPAV